MSITSIAALGGAYSFSTSPYTPPPSSTRSITQLANGSTVTTVRGATGDVVAVSTAMAAAPASPAQANPAQAAPRIATAPGSPASTGATQTATLYMIA
ncbi:hypothetical protein [Acidocella sp.]|uniref:hypothetical protein n=1 Tax=Acidocella sp. TaxID=50710 RepID=UPI0026287F1B|nr:hypothetical protein [Acidocella sp.]